MNEYLQTCKSNLTNISKHAEIFVVLGNESCDLDSVVSPLIYAYFLQQLGKNPVIPVLNIKEDEFPLRTESKYFLEKLNINVENLTFRNQIDLLELNSNNKLKLILVDHHVLSTQDKILEKSVIEIIDHRPIDQNAKWGNIEITLSTVGSCTTLIANKIYGINNSFLNKETATLLHGTIILDTINFNSEANRFTELDIEMAQKLENDYKIQYSREEIFNELVNARSDISSLTPIQILHRDMKIINGVPVPGCPMLIQDFLKLPGAVDSLTIFCQTKNCKVIVLMGLVNKNDLVYRDIGVFSIEDCQLKNKLIQKLIETNELKLNEVHLNIKGLKLYSQGNVKMSRKHIVPILSVVIKDTTICK